MQTVLLIVHLFACIALVIAVMLQRSEGGALGMGGGGTGGLISGRGAANVLVRTTMVLAAIFFATSITMTRLNAENARQPSELEKQIEGQTIDPLGGKRDPLGPTSAPSTPPPATTAPDPLSPVNPSTAPAPSATTPAPAPSTTPTPSATTPATPSATTPATPSTTPAQPDPLSPAQNGGENNP